MQNSGVRDNSFSHHLTSIACLWYICRVWWGGWFSFASFFWFLSCQVISRAAKRWMVSNSDCSSFHWTEVNMMGNRKYTQLFFAPIRIKGHWVIERTRKKVSFPIINISVHEMIDINIAFYDQTRLGMKVTRNNKTINCFTAISKSNTTSCLLSWDALETSAP